MTARERIEKALETAKAATPGPWIRLGSSTDSYNFLLWKRDDFRSCGVPDQKICEVFGQDPNKLKRVNIGEPGECTVPDDDREHNMQHIATMNPAFAAALLEGWLLMEATLDRIDGGYRDDTSDSDLAKTALASARKKLEE